MIVKAGAGLLPRICFVAPAALPLLVPELPGAHAFGGAEVQQVLIGRGLASAGFDVSFLTYGAGGAVPRAVDGVRIIPTFRPRVGPRGLRYFYARFWKLWEGMRRAHADVYYQRSLGDLTGHTVAFCRRHGRVSVFAVANDRDVDPKRLRSRPPLDRVLGCWGMRNADHVVVQAASQRMKLRETFGREAEVIPSLVRYGPVATAGDAERREVLFVGNLSPKKRPELLFDVARRVPDLPFVIVGAFTDYRTSQRMRDGAKRLPNLKVIGPVPPEELGAYYGRALALLNTSKDEGFPNAFLEAWAHEVPVLSLACDPDGILTRRGLGILCKDTQAMAFHLLRLLDLPDERRRMGRLGRAYVLERHSPEKVLAVYATYFERVAARGRPWQVTSGVDRRLVSRSASSGREAAS